MYWHWGCQSQKSGILQMGIPRLEVEKVDTQQNIHSYLGDDARETIPTDFIPSEVINPGFYTDFCAEIDLGLLALNTICASDELKNIDKETSKLVDSK